MILPYLKIGIYCFYKKKTISGKFKFLKRRYIVKLMSNIRIQFAILIGIWLKITCKITVVCKL